jgi:glycine cleavage system H protein
LVNNAAEGDAWFIKIEMSNSDEVSELMDEAAYKEHCEKEAHGN